MRSFGECMLLGALLGCARLRGACFPIKRVLLDIRCAHLEGAHSSMHPP